MRYLYRQSTMRLKYAIYCFAVIAVILTTFLLQLRDKKYSVSEAKLLLERYNHPHGMKYILQWTKPNTIPFIFMREGPETFQKRNCKYQNCFVTANRKLLKNITMFDVVAFHGPEVIWYKRNDLPTERSPDQKYVFASIESSHYYPACNVQFNAYFNWTWTYKLDSDETYGYIIIKDKYGNIIGPKTDMNWMNEEDMEPIDDKVKYKLEAKSKAAAWMVSNCNAKSGRQNFVKEVQKELKVYNLSVDIYGSCGTLQCPDPSMVVDKSDEYQPMHPYCLNVIERDYYFYFSLENSFAEDYVTEKLLHALQNYAIPVVFGGANYTRFMPDGIYLNGKELGAKKVAQKMNEIINSKDVYYNYFKWRNHYSYHSKEEDPNTDDYCKMCEMINDKELMSEYSVYYDFRSWWNPINYKC